MARTAIFSDIHSNLEALETAVAFTQKVKVDDYVVLGDTVGYGANPNECFEWANRHASVNLMGNHEKAVIDPAVRNWFNPEAKEAIEWTEKVMGKALKDQIRPLPYLNITEKASFAHASLYQPETFPYIFNDRDAHFCFSRMENSICFVGHTHVPGCFCEQTRSSEYLRPGKVMLEKENRYILNPGSVGQPRNGDSRLSLGIFDDLEYSFEIVRLEYANEAAASKIRKAGLPKYLADRLL